MRVVITHPEFGVYLGSFLGLGIWSMLDTAGQPCAVTFESTGDATGYIKSWAENNDPNNYHFVPVTPSDGNYATVGDLIKIGLGPLLGDMMATGAEVATL